MKQTDKDLIEELSSTKNKDKAQGDQKKFVESFKKFVAKTDLLQNPYVKLYNEIISNPENGSKINFTPKKRLEFLADFAEKKIRINKPYLNNILVSHINKVSGYFITERENIIYEVETRVKGKEKDFIEKIYIPEKILMNKMKRKEIRAPFLGNDFCK